MAGWGAWLIVLAVTALAGCQFASAPASVAPSPTVGRAAAVASTATPPRPTASPPGRTPTSPPRTATPPPGRTPTPGGGAAAGAAPTRTAAPAVPTLGRAVTVTATPARNGGPGAMLPAGQERVTGDIANFAASARVMRLRVDGGGERQVSLAPSATIKRADGTTGSPADLRPGQRVQATGRGSGDAAMIADEVVVLAPR